LSLFLPLVTPYTSFLLVPCPKELRLLAADVASRRKAARAHAKACRAMSEGIRGLKDARLAAARAARRAAEAAVEARPEMLGHYCHCGRPKNCRQCAAAAARRLRESQLAMPFDHGRWVGGRVGR
jgi:hypothetical protein